MPIVSTMGFILQPSVSIVCNGNDICNVKFRLSNCKPPKQYVGIDTFHRCQNLVYEFYYT